MKAKKANLVLHVIASNVVKLEDRLNHINKDDEYEYWSGTLDQLRQLKSVYDEAVEALETTFGVAS